MKEPKIPSQDDIVTKKANEIVDGGDLTVLPPVQSPMQIISQAVQRGAGEKELEILERMFVFDIKVKAQQAKEAYHRAMAAFSLDPPEILKNKKVGFDHKNDDGRTEYSHATLDNVSINIQQKLSPHGLHASWRTEQGEKGMITVTCTVSHALGHSESTGLSHSPDDSGKKNSIQAIGSTITYLERYTILALTGLATKGQDDDGQNSAPPGEEIDDEQFANITALIEEVSANEVKFCKYLKIPSVDKMPVSLYEKAVKLLEGKRK